MSCPTDCNLKDCPLRVKRNNLKACKCNTTKDNCYYCLVHVCPECSENRDELEAGMRRCGKGECHLALVEDWEAKNSSNIASKNDLGGNSDIKKNTTGTPSKPTRCKSY